MNIDNLNDNYNNKLLKLKSQIVSSPEKLILLTEDLKENILSSEKINLNLETDLKFNEKHLINLEHFLKLTSDLEISIKELEKTENKFQEITNIIILDSDLKTKKEKSISEINSKINNVHIQIEKMQDYHKEFNLRLKKNLDIEDSNLEESKEKFQNSQKKLNEIKALIKEQEQKNAFLEDGVK